MKLQENAPDEEKDPDKPPLTELKFVQEIENAYLHNATVFASEKIVKKKMRNKKNTKT